MTYTPTTDDLIDTYVIWHLQSYRNRTVDVAQQAERDLRAQAEKTLATHDAEVRAQALAPIREALAGHPRCDIHPDGDPITCGWKRAVASVQAALDKEDR